MACKVKGGIKSFYPRAVLQMARVLRPGGRLVMLSPSRQLLLQVPRPNTLPLAPPLPPPLPLPLPYPSPGARAAGAAVDCRGAARRQLRRLASVPRALAPHAHPRPDPPSAHREWQHARRARLRPPRPVERRARRRGRARSTELTLAPHRPLRGTGGRLRRHVKNIQLIAQ